MNGAHTLVKMLGDYDVKVIFGVPGDTSVALYQALKQANAGGSPCAGHFLSVPGATAETLFRRARR